LGIQEQQELRGRLALVEKKEDVVKKV